MKDFLIAFWSVLCDMSPYLLLGFAVAGVLKVLIPAELVRRHLGGRGIWPILKSSLLGVPLPLCSCGVIPVAVSLRTQGASAGAVVAFLLSTPQTGIDSILVTYSLLGLVLMLFRPIAALIIGIIGGTLTDIFSKNSLPDIEKNISEDSNKKTNRFTTALRHGFIVLPRDISTAMLVGLLIAAVISIFVPDDFFAEKIGTGLGAMALMLLAGIPVYVCATASVPIAAAMIAKGLTPGAALVFLMTGPATNAAAFATLWKILGGRVAIIYLLTVCFCAIASGIILDSCFGNLAITIQQHYHQMQPSILEHLSAVLLLLILFFGIYNKHKKTT